jgi:ATPase subunit of ABC transporter with duplicated ATPase domains
VPSGSLTVSNLSKFRGPVVVLDRVSLTVGPGDRVGIVGPNGVGKSTLLRLIAGLDEPDGGEVQRRPPEATVGYLPQEADVRPGETLLEALSRRTGVTAADRALQASSAALADGAPGADERYVADLERYLALGGPDLPSRAAEVCEDLGLPASRLDVELAALSGGQLARAGLAAVLLSRFDVFLLDEPTNDLDFEGLAQLERFLGGLQAGAVIVSHDRAFLDRTITRVYEIDEHTHEGREFGGGWGAYLEERERARQQQYEAHDTYQSEKGRLEDRARRQKQWSATGVAKAKRSSEPDKNIRFGKMQTSEKLAGKVKITQKAIERLEVVDKPWEGWRLELDLSVAKRSGDVVARLAGAVVERGTFRLGPVDLEVAWGDRLAIVGAYGSGKTSLLGALLGRFPLASGAQWLGPGVEVGELDQARGAFLGEGDLLRAFGDASGLVPGEARTLLAKFGLGTEHVLRPASSLSPGERTRAVLALLQHRQANCLVLDEPTNHLDLPAIEQLESALDGYEGTVLLVTHDRALLDAVEITRTVVVAHGEVRSVE